MNDCCVVCSVKELRILHDTYATHIHDIPDYHIRIFHPEVKKDFMFMADSNLPKEIDRYHHLVSKKYFLYSFPSLVMMSNRKVLLWRQIGFEPCPPNDLKIIQEK